MPLHSIGPRLQEELDDAIATVYPIEDVQIYPEDVQAMARELSPQGLFTDRRRLFNVTRNDTRYDNSSRIVPINLPPELHSRLRSEIDQIAAINAEIRQRLHEPGKPEATFSDLNINFFSFPIFSPAAGEFIQVNRERLQEIFPGHDGIYGEFFQISGTHNTPIHSGGSNVVNAIDIARYVDSMNLHVTLNDSDSLACNPFLVWEGCDEEVTSSRYCYNYLVRRGLVDAHNREALLQAVALSERKNKTDYRLGSSFLVKRYLRERYCRELRREVHGLYALYEPGHGFLFSPNRPHGGQLLQREFDVAWAGRTSFIIRSVTLDRWRFFKGKAGAFLANPFASGRSGDAAESTQNDFYATLLGYPDGAALLDALYGGMRPVVRNGFLISLKGRRNMVSLDALQRHYDRCADFLANPRFTDRAQDFLRRFQAEKVRHSDYAR